MLPMRPCDTCFGAKLLEANNYNIMGGRINNDSVLIGKATDRK